MQETTVVFTCLTKKDYEKIQHSSSDMSTLFVEKWRDSETDEVYEETKIFPFNKCSIALPVEDYDISYRVWKKEDTSDDITLIRKLSSSYPISGADPRDLPVYYVVRSLEPFHSQCYSSALYAGHVASSLKAKGAVDVHVYMIINQEDGSYQKVELH